jgi:hypothetical protein
MEVTGPITADDCVFCGKHCGHTFFAIALVKHKNGHIIGFFTKDCRIVLINTCGNYTWICEDCSKEIFKLFSLQKGEVNE